MKSLINTNLLFPLLLFMAISLNSQNFSQMHIINSSGIQGRKAIAADLDNDLDADVLVVSGTTPTYVCWYENIDSGDFGSQNIISTENDRDIYAIDIDNDTFKDVLTCDWDYVYWYRNKQDGTFELAQELPGGYPHSPNTVCSADINGDGHNDLISVWDAPNPGLSTTLNLGNGLFEPISGIYSGEFESIYPVDLDEDGDIDLITSDYYYDLAYFENIDGSIYHPVVLREDYRPNNLMPADMDNDGDLDIVSTYSSVWVGWFENDGNTQFPIVHTIFEVDSTYGSEGLFVCDLDNDNDQDVICSFWDWNLLAWFENVDNGVFSNLKVISADLLTPISVYCSDFDNDGDMDVLCTSLGDSLVVWFENDLSTGVEEDADEFHILLYPNPASKVLYISSEITISGANAKIYNLSGQLVVQTKLTDNSVSVSTLKNGIYFLGIITDQGEIRSKFIVQD